MIEFEAKMLSLPMPVAAATPGTQSRYEVLSHTETKPELSLTLTEQQPEPINCFASGQGRIPVERSGNVYVARAESDLPVGRSRYNCTYSSAWPGRFYWYSYAWLRKGPENEWVHE